MQLQSELNLIYIWLWHTRTLAERKLCGLLTLSLSPSLSVALSLFVSFSPVTACCYRDSRDRCALSMQICVASTGLDTLKYASQAHLVAHSPSLSLALFLWLISNFSHAGGCSSSNDDNFRLPFILGVGERQTNCRRGVSFVCSLYWPPSSVRLSSCPSVRSSGCPVVRPARLPVRVVHSDAKAAAFELCRRRSRKFHQLLRKFSFFSSRFSLSLACVFVLLISAVWRGHLPTRCAFSARNAGGRHAAVSLTPTRAPALPLCMPSHKSRTEQAAQTATLAIRASFACSPCVGLCLRLHLRLRVRLWMELLLR